LHAEGQRRYLESLSSYARQFLGQVAKPDVDMITGLSPTISIQQKAGGWNPRSTVATVTQIHDYLRVLFARIGEQHCTRCDKPITAQTRDQILARVLSLGDCGSVMLLAPIARKQKGEFRDLFEDTLRRGFARARVDGEVVKLTQAPALDRNIRHDIEIVVDRVVIKSSAKSRLAQAIETALELGDGTIIVLPIEESASADRSGGSRETKGLLLSSRYACTHCDLSFEPPSPQLFSFNSPTGMCLTCDGLGTRFDFDADLLTPNPSKSFLGLAIEPMRVKIGKWRKHIYQAVAKELGVSLTTPWKNLPPRARDGLLYGLGDKHLTFEWKWSGGVWRHGGAFDGVIKELRDKHRKAKSSFVRAYYEKYMRKTRCPDCGGARLNRQALAVKIGGLSLHECLTMPIAAAADFLSALKLTTTQQVIAEDVLKEVHARLRFLMDVGLHYLTLDRTAPTLSGGESQRIRLASQIGSGLVGVLYVLDEPSIGLHARDNRRLLDSLLRLRDMGNTVIVVEHDEETMRTADVIVDFGPGPGVKGGHVVVSGSFDEVAACDRSITGRYLSGTNCIAVPTRRRAVGACPKHAPTKRRRSRCATKP